MRIIAPCGKSAAPDAPPPPTCSARPCRAPAPAGRERFPASCASEVSCKACRVGGARSRLRAAAARGLHHTASCRRSCSCSCSCCRRRRRRLRCPVDASIIIMLVCVLHPCAATQDGGCFCCGFSVVILTTPCRGGVLVTKSPFVTCVHVAFCRRRRPHSNQSNY